MYLPRKATHKSKLFVFNLQSETGPMESMIRFESNSLHLMITPWVESKRLNNQFNRIKMRKLNIDLSLLRLALEFVD